MLDDIKPSGGSGWQVDKPSAPPPKPDLKIDDAIEVPDVPTSQPPKKTKKWWHIISFRHTHLSKPKWALLVFGLLLAMALGGFGALKLYQHVRKVPPAAVTPKKKTVVKPKLEPSRLSGLPVDPALNKRPVTGVMIENSPDARPQSGLKEAGVVFEAIAEGGITRFLALFEDTQPNYIGPVRSARPYYLDWAMSFDASLAHVGGSPDALGDIRALKVRDLDQFANASAYTRIKSRYAPHNVYTSTANLDALNQKKGYNTSSFTSWPRKADKKVETPNARSIDFAVSGYLYSPHYGYDPVSNSYLRSEAGKPHVDERTGAQLAPKVVIALVLGYRIAGDRIHSVYTTTGAGHMFVFQDGTVTEGSWQKANRNSQYTFTDANGAPLKLNAGQTWLTMVSSNSAVTYKP